MNLFVFDLTVDLKQHFAYFQEKCIFFVKFYIQSDEHIIYPLNSMHSFYYKQSNRKYTHIYLNQQRIY